MIERSLRSNTGWEIPVWYLVKGTKRFRDRVPKFLPSYEGPFFVVGCVDGHVYVIKRHAHSKAKVVHHDKLKPYKSREALANAWVFKQAECFRPVERLPPVAESGRGTELPESDDQGQLDCPASDSDSDSESERTRPSRNRPHRRRNPPELYGDWVHSVQGQELSWRGSWAVVLALLLCTLCRVYETLV